MRDGSRTLPRLSILLVCLLWISSAASAGRVRAGGPLAEPDELGPWAVGHTTFAVADPARPRPGGDRTLPVDAWYPVDPGDATGPLAIYDLVFTGRPAEVALEGPAASTQGPFPLIVFSHGSHGIRFGSSFLCEQLASHGMVVVAPDHVGNSAIDLVFPGTPFLTRDRPLDVSLVITDLLERNAEATDPFFDRVDVERIGVVGHSFGGFTALAIAAGFQDVPPDPRVRAIMASAPGTGGLDLGSIDIPTFVLGGTADTVNPIDPHSIRVFDEVRARPRYRVDVLGALHGSFTNVCDRFEALLDPALPQELRDLFMSLGVRRCPPEVIAINEETRRVTNLYGVAFFKVYVVGDPRYTRFLTPGRVERDGLPVEFFAVRGGGNARR